MGINKQCESRATSRLRRLLIEIGTKDNGSETVIFIKDNGMGIEPKYQKKVFGLFDKLNHNSEGTGIGLALIKRIIETHGE
jgi:two-component system sensor kinase FixL